VLIAEAVVSIDLFYGSVTGFSYPHEGGEIFCAWSTTTGSLGNNLPDSVFEMPLLNSDGELGSVLPRVGKRHNLSLAWRATYLTH
jgi:hypothetical protein